MNLTKLETGYIDNNEEFFLDGSCEDAHSYAFRKRAADLSHIVDIILKNELTEKERNVLFDTVLYKKSAREIFQKYDVASSYIYRIRDKAMQKLQDFLKYVLIYQTECEKTVLSPLEFKKILGLSSVKLSQSNSFSHRLRKLMARENLTPEMVSESTDFDLNRLEMLIEGSAYPTINETIHLADYFQTTTDYLLRGI